MSKSLIVACLIAMLLVSAAVAQQSPPTLKSNISNGTPETVPALLIEITYNPTQPPVFLDVRGLNEKATWIWMTNFMTVPGWQKSPKELPTRAVRVEPQFNGETIDVRVSVLRGHHMEEEELVGKYQLGIGEPKRVQKLESFGIQPFDLIVKSVRLPLPPNPTIDLRVTSIEVVKVDREAAPMPGYRVFLRNTASKNIDAVKLDVVNGVSSFLQGEEGQALIEPGLVYEHYVPVANTVRDGVDYVPAPMDAVTLMISSVVYSDGSFEGDKSIACMYESFKSGRRLFLKQVISFMESASDLSATEFKDRLHAMTFATRGEAISDCRLSKGSIESTARGLRVQMLRDLEQIISTRPKPPIEFGSWLKSTKVRYSNWLARLEQKQ